MPYQIAGRLLGRLRGRGLGEDLESLEVNPLLVDGTRIEALDAVVTWREHS